LIYAKLHVLGDISKGLVGIVSGGGRKQKAGVPEPPVLALPLMW